MPRILTTSPNLILKVAFQLGHEVPTKLQLLYIGVFAFVVAGLVQLLDDKDRFFSSDITKITVYEWGIYIGITFSGNKTKYCIIMF